ncbi:cytochrome P450 3A9 [Cladorrhinum sp. PSN332]|nr:cytochrome P450 3A9 [Cladorrhinum sp. PSN332]
MAFTLVLGGLLLLVGPALLYVYYQTFPLDPLPEIPYNKETIDKPLGDIGPMRRKARETKESTVWLFEVARRVGSPLTQLLAVKFAKRMLLLDDPREAEDILTRRQNDFDRSPIFTRYFRPMLSHCTIGQFSTPALKAQKKLWSECMNTGFLNRVVAPNIYAGAQDVVELWRLKAAQSGGEAFEVSDDFANAALDVIWVAILGSKLGVVREDIEQLRHGPGYKKPDMTAAVAVQETVEYMTSIFADGMNGMFPSWTIFLLKLKPRYHRFKRACYRELETLMTKACDRFQHVVMTGKETDGEELDTCAMDLVLRREVLMARKEKRPIPDPTKNPAMLHELLLLLIAGHDSTGSTLSWFAKIIALYPDAQAKLRTALRAAFPAGSQPSAQALLLTDIPYLDAFVEELIRCSTSIGLIIRHTVRDTTVLGKPVPAGTQIIINTRFPTRGTYPPVDESLRSETCQAAQQRKLNGGIEGPPGEDLDQFKPERWLVTVANGKETFDGTALPNLIFGGGFRGCFGKKLAMRELKIIIAVLVMEFEFLEVEEKLKSMEGEERLFRRPIKCYVKLRAFDIVAKMSSNRGARQTRAPLRSHRVETPVHPPQIPQQSSSRVGPQQHVQPPPPPLPEPIRDRQAIEAQEAWLMAHALRYEHPEQAQTQGQVRHQSSQPLEAEPQPQPQGQTQTPSFPTRQSEDGPVYHTINDADYDPAGANLRLSGSQSWYDWQREEENERRKRKFEESQRAVQERARKNLRDKSRGSEGSAGGSADGSAEDEARLQLAAPTICQEITPLQLPAIRPTLMLGPYPTRDAATEAAMEYAIAQGYMLVMTGTCKEKPLKGEFESDMPVIRVDMMCDRGGVCKSAGTGKRKRTTHRLGCPARMKLVSRKRDCRHWFIETVCEQHNHNLSPGNMEGLAAYRRWRRKQAGRTGPETQQERYERNKRSRPPKPAPTVPPPVFHSLATPAPPVMQQKTSEPKGPVHMAALKGQCKILEILLNKGADVNAVDPSGRTPLHCGVEGGRMDAVRLLLDRGADVTKLTAKGVSVLQLAVEKDLEDAVLMFIERGADPNV